MTLLDAYKKAKRVKGNNVLVECRDFSDSWGFSFTDKKLSSEDLILGGGYYIVHKSTGHIDFYSIPEILDLLENSPSIDVTTLDKSIKNKVKWFAKSKL